MRLSSRVSTALRGRDVAISIRASVHVGRIQTAQGGFDITLLMKRLRKTGLKTRHPRQGGWATGR
ncbi:MAG: hypothetical protein NTW07_08655 [candidate division Zixibacteria bacterium]|nr:hypothetical protein [candidate division Zixibacteria bacterium]